jgi:hypothetical protein
VKAEQSCKVELRHQSAWKANCSFQQLFCHREALYIFKSSSRVFGTSGHCILILFSVELQWGLHLRLLDIINETRRDLYSKKIQFTLSAPRFIYFSKGSPVLLHRSHTDTDCICKWCVNDEENTFLKRFLGAIKSKDHFLFSYLRSMGRFFDQSSTPDNIQDVNSIEDDEHRPDQV